MHRATGVLSFTTLHNTSRKSSEAHRVVVFLHLQSLMLIEVLSIEYVAYLGFYKTHREGILQLLFKIIFVHMFNMLLGLILQNSHHIGCAELVCK